MSLFSPRAPALCRTPRGPESVELMTKWPVCSKMLHCCRPRLSRLISVAACSSNNPISAAQVAGVINARNRRKLGSISIEILSVSRPGQNLLCSMNHIIHSIIASFPTAQFRVELHQCIFIGLFLPLKA